MRRDDKGFVISLMKLKKNEDYTIKKYTHHGQEKEMMVFDLSREAPRQLLLDAFASQWPGQEGQEARAKLADQLDDWFDSNALRLTLQGKAWHWKLVPKDDKKAAVKEATKRNPKKHQRGAGIEAFTDLRCVVDEAYPPAEEPQPAGTATTTTTPTPTTDTATTQDAWIPPEQAQEIWTRQLKELMVKQSEFRRLDDEIRSLVVNAQTS